MSIEYTIWGIPPGQTEEVVLVSPSVAKDRERAEWALKRCRELGATQCRIQEIDMDTPPDFAGTINGIDRRRR